MENGTLVQLIGRVSHTFHTRGGPYRGSIPKGSRGTVAESAGDGLVSVDFLVDGEKIRKEVHVSMLVRQ